MPGLRVRHLNCATMRPVGPGWLTPRTMVCHCLLIETQDGLVLVDSGIGCGDVQDARRRLGTPFLWFARPRLSLAETAAQQIEALGYQRSDVRHIVLTHCDLDHASGLPDFPQARVHIYAAELEAALHPPTLFEQHRYLQHQWAHGPEWRAYQTEGEPWHGFDCVRRLEGLPAEILLIPLAGHSRGHAGIAVERGQGWLLHCGDAYFSQGEVGPNPSCPPGLSLFQRLVAVDDVARRANQQRLRELAAAGSVQVVNAHDAGTLEQCRAAGHD